MPRCNGCGASGFRLVTWQCLVCSKAACHSCGSNWKFLYEDHRLDRTVCSQNCFMHWFWTVFPDYRSQAFAEFSWARGLDPTVINMLDMYLARAYEQEGQYTRAAQIYERYFLEAELARVTTYVRQQRDEMLAKFRAENRWITMDCPKCGGLNKVGPETRLDTLASCYNCGKEYTDFDFVGMLQRAMGLVKPSGPGGGQAGQAEPQAKPPQL